jgi:hypothetical protein
VAVVDSIDVDATKVIQPEGVDRKAG